MSVRLLDLFGYTGSIICYDGAVHANKKQKNEH